MHYFSRALKHFGMIMSLVLVLCSAHGAGHSEAVVGLWASPRECPDATCSVYQLSRKDDRVCGHWAYFATNASYEGRLVGLVEDTTRIRVERVCGIRGGIAESYCPEPSDFASTLDGQPRGWSQPRRRNGLTFLICGGKLSETDAQGCSGLTANQRMFGFERVSSKHFPVQVGKSKVEQQWLHSCLRGGE